METKHVPLSLYGLSPSAINEALSIEKAYEGKQIFRWLAKGAKDFQSMSDLSKTERERLTLLMPSLSSSQVVDSHVEEGATKLVIRLFDSSLVECVMLSDKEGRHTACLSSQVGCPMHCAFCRTGTMGFARNLATEEIIEQFVHLSRLAPITHIVFMGMGEPFLNMDSVLAAIAYFHDEDGYAISHRRITISTSGIIDGIVRLTRLRLPVKLAISLVSADDKLRSRLMPVNRRYPLATLKSACREYQECGGKRFTFEYCMLSGVNTTEGSAKKLASYIRGLDVIINLIPYNEAAELPWETPSREEIDKFCHYLDMMHVNYTIRFSKGANINGACGQLATKAKEEQTT